MSSSPQREIDPEVRPYSVGAAWRRAIVYALACLVLGVVTGAVSAMLTEPPATSEQLGELGWWVWTIACFAVAVVGYWVIWPIGTLAHGRPLRPSATVFGVMWGLAEGTLFASVWVLTDGLLDPTWLALAVTFVVLSAYLGLWHQLYWDVKVAPEHNIPEWNARKVLFVHVPNLLVTLPYLAATGCVAIFVAVQAVGLVGAARAMHFPGFPGWRAVLPGGE